MFRTSAVIFALTVSGCAVAQAASPINTKMTVTATATLATTSASATGTVAFSPGIPDTTGTFSATISLGASLSGPFTITLPGGSLVGTLTLPISILQSTTSASGGTATITGGTGSYAGATGSFPSLSGTGSVSTTISVTFSGSGSITLGGGGTTTIPPSITAVLDGASNTANVAEGGIFIVKGTNLCPSSATGINSFSVPRPTVAPDGVKITFTPAAGGTGIPALLVYEYNSGGVTQLAGILPSTVAAGNYNVTVTNGTASPAVQVTVVASKFTLFTQDNSGSGLATVQNYISATQYDLNRFTTGTVNGTTISPARPGQTLIAYGTGMGPYAAGDNSASPVYDFSTNGVNVKAIVGGMTLPVAYAGYAGYAGEIQVNVTLPSNVPTGCTVSFQISVNGALSNATFVSIAPNATSNACVATGFTTQQLQSFDQGGTYTVGAFSILNYNEAISGQSFIYGAAAGGFLKYTGFQLSGAASANVTSYTSGSCTVSTYTSGTSSVVVTTTGGTYLDAGAVTLNGPSGSNLTNTALTETNNSYELIIGTNIPIPGAVNGNLVAGTYSLKGAGGKDVGPFNASVTVGAPLVVTGGLPASVNRSSGLTLNWTGGNSSDLLEISGSSFVSSTGSTTSTTFVCITTAGQGTFTVPSSILTQLPATTTGGSLVVASGAFTSFQAPLVAGGNIDTGIFTSFSGVANSPTYQ